MYVETIKTDNALETKALIKDIIFALLEVFPEYIKDAMFNEDREKDNIRRVESIIENTEKIRESFIKDIKGDDPDSENTLDAYIEELSEVIMDDITTEPHTLETVIKENLIKILPDILEDTISKVMGKFADDKK